MDAIQAGTRMKRRQPGRKGLAGSLVGGIAETPEMLDFCGQHGITSDIERVRIQHIDTASLKDEVPA